MFSLDSDILLNCLYLPQPFNSAILERSWNWFYFNHPGERSCPTMSYCHVPPPPPIGSKRRCTKSCSWPGAPKGTWGQTLTWDLGFLCKTFSAICFACVPLSASVCYCNLFFFFLRWHLFWGEFTFFLMKLNKVSYKSHLFSTIRLLV